MELTLTPYKSLGAFEFNAPRHTIRGIMKDHANNLATHARSDGKVADDTYENLGLEFVYTKYDRLGAVELKSPSTLMFNGDDLMAKTWKELLLQFQMLDSEIQISSKDFISYKYGIAVFAPEKDTNPNVLPTSITAFDEKFFYHKDGIADPQYLNTFHIHVPYIRIRTHSTNGESKPENLNEIFSEVREKGIILWNQLPITLDYSNDLPEILEPIVELLEKMSATQEGAHNLELKCPSFTCLWKVKWNNTFVLIDANWSKIKGGYEAALNDTDPNIGELTLVKTEFIAEWKMPLLQVSNGLKAAKIERELYLRVRKLESLLDGMGKFYKKDKQLISTTINGRKKVDFRSIRQWQMLQLALFIVALVALPIVYFGFDSSTYWYVKLGRNIALTVIIGMPVFLLLKAMITRRK